MGPGALRAHAVVSRPRARHTQPGGAAHGRPPQRLPVEQNPPALQDQVQARMQGPGTGVSTRAEPPKHRPPMVQRPVGTGRLRQGSRGGWGEGAPIQLRTLQHVQTRRWAFQGHQQTGRDHCHRGICQRARARLRVRGLRVATQDPYMIHLAFSIKWASIQLQSHNSHNTGSQVIA
jgi:hypothetical protein